MEAKNNFENEFIESFGNELAIGLDIDQNLAYNFALNFTEALTASNADLFSIKQFFQGR